LVDNNLSVNNLVVEVEIKDEETEITKRHQFLKGIKKAANH